MTDDELTGEAMRTLVMGAHRFMAERDAFEAENARLRADLIAVAPLLREFADKVEAEWGPGVLTNDEWALIERIERVSKI